ncbi:MAG: hypothetical protein ACRENI_10535 [Gemmatimonadaceae bacterium]
MQPRTIISLAGLVVVTACLGPNEPVLSERDYGFFVLHSSGDPQTATTSPVAVFLRSRPLRIPPPTPSSDSCAVLSLSPAPSILSPTYLFAGEAVTVELSGQMTALVRNDAGEDTIPHYELPGGGSIPFDPGDVVTFTIPGSDTGFAAREIAGPTAEAVTLSPVGVPAAGDPLPLAWNPPGDEQSKMVISLRYASPGSPQLNRQVYCELFDDGAHEIEPDLLDGWRNSYQDMRLPIASRLRVTITGSGQTLTQILSIHDDTSTVAPAGT